MQTDAHHAQLAGLLRKRLEVIGDHELRSRDPDAHLRQLQEASEAITALHETLRPELPPRLNHFLAQASYDKALAHLEEMLDGGAS